MDAGPPGIGGPAGGRVEGRGRAAGCGILEVE